MEAVALSLMDGSMGPEGPEDEDSVYPMMPTVEERVINQVIRMNDKTLRPPLPKGAVTQIESVTELPEDWWKIVPNDRSAYNYRTRTHLMGIPTETLLDGGAGVNSVPEEVVIGLSLIHI